MMAAYNELFLLYVALFSLSLFAFVLSLLALDVATLPAHITGQFPRRAIAGFALVLGVLLTLLWLGRLGPALLAGTPPVGLESYTTLVIQVLDLGIIVPAAIMTGVLLIRRVPLGTVLAVIVLVFGLSMGAAVTAMGIGQVLAGVATSPIEAGDLPRDCRGESRCCSSCCCAASASSRSQRRPCLGNQPRPALVLIWPHPTKANSSAGGGRITWIKNQSGLGRTPRPDYFIHSPVPAPMGANAGRRSW